MRRPLQVFIKERCVKIPEAGCWIWEGALSAGYGSFRNTRKEPTKSAHRESYKAFYGNIPKGMHVLHRCDVRACCNPHHLMLGTNQDNIEDSVRKGRRKGISGKRGITKIGMQYNWTTKPGPKELRFSVAQVEDMRKRWEEGETQVSIARFYKVNSGYVSRIVRGEIYK